MAPPHLKRILPEIFLMTSHLNSHRTTDIKSEMLSGVQTGNGTPHDKYNIRGIAHARTNRKDDTFMQRRLVQNFISILEWGQGTCLLSKAHMGLGIFPIFFPCMLPTPLCGIFGVVFIFLVVIQTPIRSRPYFSISWWSVFGKQLKNTRTFFGTPCTHIFGTKLANRWKVKKVM